LHFDSYESAVKALWGQIWEQREKNLENKTNLSIVEVEEQQFSNTINDLEINYQKSLRNSNEIRQRILQLSARLEELGDFKVC